MVYLSELINRPVMDANNEKIGVLADLFISTGEVFPRVVALVVSTPRVGSLIVGGDTIVVAVDQMCELNGHGVALKVPRAQVRPYTPCPGLLLLRRDVLDKQIVDMSGRRVVKVNDLKLTQVGEALRLVGADISMRAFLRRLGAERLSHFLPLKLPERLITWNYVEPLEAETADVRLTVPQSRLADLHPADLADLMEQMAADDRASVLEGLPDEVAADAITELEPAVQAEVMEDLDAGRASDLLEIMPPDEAADILGDLSPARAEELLAGMAAEEAEDVRDLLQYGEHTAGGLMTPDVFVLERAQTVEDALARLREVVPEVVFYLYVVDEQRRLAGVVSLRRLVTARPDQQMKDLMEPDIIKVTADTDQEEVARTIGKYNLLALPVVDEEGRLLGVVTVDDVLDVMHQEAAEDISQMAGTTVDDVQRVGPFWMAAVTRLGWAAVTVVGGILAGMVIRTFAGSLQSALALAYFIPLLLSVGGLAAAQTLAVVGQALNTGDRRGVLRRELSIALLVASASGLATGAVAFLWLGQAPLALAVGISMVAIWLAAVLAGAAMPVALERLHVSPTLLSSPALSPALATVNMLLYLSLASLFLMSNTTIR